MQLYVANCTKQNMDFIYRVPEENGTKRQMIRRGAQERIYAADASMLVLNAIIGQHAKYGLTDVKEIDRRKPFIGLCFSIDKPVNVEAIMRADEHNAGVLTETSLEQRRLSAAFLANALNKAAEGAATVNEVEFSLVEQNDRTEPGMNESVLVTRDPSSAQPAQSRRGRRARS